MITAGRCGGTAAGRTRRTPARARPGAARAGLRSAGRSAWRTATRPARTRGTPAAPARPVTGQVRQEVAQADPALPLGVRRIDDVANHTRPSRCPSSTRVPSPGTCVLGTHGTVSSTGSPGCPPPPAPASRCGRGLGQPRLVVRRSPTRSCGSAASSRCGNVTTTRLVRAGPVAVAGWSGGPPKASRTLERMRPDHEEPAHPRDLRRQPEHGHQEDQRPPVAAQRIASPDLGKGHHGTTCRSIAKMLGAGSSSRAGTAGRAAPATQLGTHRPRAVAAKRRVARTHHRDEDPRAGLTPRPRPGTGWASPLVLALQHARSVTKSRVRTRVTSAATTGQIRNDAASAKPTPHANTCRGAGRGRCRRRPSTQVRVRRHTAVSGSAIGYGQGQNQRGARYQPYRRRAKSVQCAHHREEREAPGVGGPAR